MAQQMDDLNDECPVLLRGDFRSGRCGHCQRWHDGRCFFAISDMWDEHVDKLMDSITAGMRPRVVSSQANDVAPGRKEEIG